MTAGCHPIAHRRLRAPREHGQTLIDPPRQEVGTILAANCQLSRRQGFRRGHQQNSFVVQARRELVSAAFAYTRQYRDVGPTPDLASPIVMSGHQPELFHAGVWFKNFLLSSIATQHQATAINLIVDNDAVDHPAIRVPTGSRESPRVETVDLDSGGDALPYEQRIVQDASLFASFASRVAEVLRPWSLHPLLTDLWPAAIEGARSTGNLGQAIARARHVLEGRCGLQTLEVPLSVVAAQPCFRAFALTRLWNADELRRNYNGVLHAYRAIHHIRNRVHPVPDLAQDGEWCETPFWVWTNEQPQRRRLSVRQSGNALQLTDRLALALELPGDEDLQLEVWAKWEQRGIKIRPRALMTTMYARLVLCDLFIHGIGGAKYDEVTDALIRSSMNIEPPRFLTATATVRLPIDIPHTTAADLQEAQHAAHELRYRAEHYMSDEAAHSLLEKKRSLLAQIPPRGAKLDWHHAITQVNQELHQHAAAEQQRLDQRAAQLAEQLRLARLLGSREFSFALFPAENLPPLLLDLSRAAT